MHRSCSDASGFLGGWPFLHELGGDGGGEVALGLLALGRAACSLQVLSHLPGSK